MLKPFFIDDDNDNDVDDCSSLLGLRLASIVSWLAIIYTYTNDDDDSNENDDYVLDNDRCCGCKG